MAVQSLQSLFFIRLSLFTRILFLYQAECYLMTNQKNLFNDEFIVAWFQDNKDARHVKTYEVSLKDKDFVEGPWSQNNLDNGAELLIPVPPPFGGVLIIGEETIVYCSASAFKAIPIRPVSRVSLFVVPQYIL